MSRLKALPILMVFSTACSTLRLPSIPPPPTFPPLHCAGYPNCGQAQPLPPITPKPPTGKRRPHA